MMGLDRGGQCHGMIFRLPAAQLYESLDKLFRREMVVKTSSNVPRWLTARTVDGHIRVVAFVVNQQSPHYSGKLELDAVADVLSTAAGHWGSCAEYLQQTVAHLEEIGIRDRNLWRLQAMVAERITRERDRLSG